MSFNALDASQQKVLLSSKLLNEQQKSQCMTMAALSSANIKYTAEELSKVSGISAETMANWGLTQSTDSLTMSQLAELASSDAQAKKVLEKIIAQNAQKVANGEITASNVGLAASEGTATLATGSFTTAIKANIAALKTWMTSTPLGWITMIAGGIILAVKVFDWATDSVEELQVAMENSVGAYEAAKTELSGITSELESNEKAMSELLAKDKLTFAEKGQLQELKEINAELRMQKDLQEKNVDKEKKKSAIDASKLYKKQFGDYEISSKKIDEYEQNADIMGNNAILISDENDISSMLAGYRQFIELREQAFKDRDQYDIDHFTELTGDIKENLFETAQELQTQKDAMSDYYNALKDIPYDNLTSEQKQVVDAYNETSEAILLIYKELDRATWNELQFSKVTQEFSDTTQELQKLGKEGKVTAEMLNDPKYDAFIQKLIDIEFISDDTEGSLRFVASAFNGTMQSAQKYVISLKGNEINNFIKNLNNEAKALGTTESELAKLTAAHVIFNNTGLSTEQQQQALQMLASKIATTSTEMKYLLTLFNYASGNFNVAGASTMTDQERRARSVHSRAYLKEKYGIDLSPIPIPEKEEVAPYTPSGGDGNGGGGSGGGGNSSGSDKNEVLDKYLEDAEKRYKVHQDETRYINELNYALHNLAKTEEEQIDISDKIDEAYRDLADNRIKDIEHQIELQEKLNGENVNVLEYYDKIQSIASEEADRLRGIGYDDNSNEIQELQNKWWDAQNKKLDFYSKQHENIIRDVEHAMDMATESNPYADTTSFYQQLKDEYHKEAERLRALDPEKYKEEIHELQLAWWEAHNAIVDWRWNNSQNWISDRNTYNDWALFDDSEVDAWERVVKWLKEEYPNDLEKIKEAEQSLFEARKKEFDKANDLGNTYIESQKTLLQSYYDVTNSIAEAQHEINKELETSKTMYEWLDEDTRKLLFNQEDYNVLSEELYDIQYRADKLKRQYERDLENSTLSTVEAITSNYEMQYETLMKSYEIAKADLEIAKKKQKLNNVLNERNVRMFINGQWQWVANTEDVINAKSELADAEYAKRVEESGLAQQQSIDNLTKQQDELSAVINKFENGVIDLEEAIDLAIGAIGNLPSALSSMYSSARINSPSYSSGSRGSFNGVQYDSNTDYMAKIQRASTLSEALSYNDKRNAKIIGEKLNTETLSSSDVEKLFKNKHADGTNYTHGGMTLLGEEGFEAYISSNGHLIPIKQPTVGNISSGGIVFNTEQMKSLRTLWDMSNINIDTGVSLLNNSQPRQIDQSQDNRIIIDKLVVDNGSSDGQALVSALRRYIGNH